MYCIYTWQDVRHCIYTIVQDVRRTSLAVKGLMHSTNGVFRGGAVGMGPPKLNPGYATAFDQSSNLKNARAWI